MYSFNDLLNAIKPNATGYDVDTIERAYEAAAKAHRGAAKRSGEPYISHPVSVAIILANLGMDTDAVVAGLLHDAVSDIPSALSEIREQFGESVALLVAGVEKLGMLLFCCGEKGTTKNIQNMLDAMSRDARGIIIKLADRLDNMRDIDLLHPQRQRKKALETMQVYVPIAHRLGVRIVAEELEDICLRCLEPEAYAEIVSMLESCKKDRGYLSNQIIPQISERLGDNFPNLYIDVRVKNIYGIYKKIHTQARAFEEIYDIYAVRIIVDSIIECYEVLGTIHDFFCPLPNRFQDYITAPKPNMYQSLHTTVRGKEPIPFFVQIRTWDMHHTAECGILYNWKPVDKPKNMKGVFVDSVDDLNFSGDSVTSPAEDEIYMSLKMKYVFTPKGEVIELPAGATVIDFAYAIHSEVGNRMIGAKIDGRIVPLDTQVQSGSTVNIITTSKENYGPKRDWLMIAVTASARRKIRRWFKRADFEEN